MKLRTREKEVLSWAAQGKTAEETGEILGISNRTVEWHLKNVRNRIGAANVVHAVFMATKAGVLPHIITIKLIHGKLWSFSYLTHALDHWIL